jgi:hypothetical protein
MFRSTDNGANWTTANVGLGNRYVSAVASNGTHVIAGTNDGLYRSSDDGQSWKRVTTGLPSTSILTITAIGSDFLVGAGGQGIVRSDNNGDTWRIVSDGLKNPVVFAMAASGTNLFVGTWGGSVWRRPLLQLAGVGDGISMQPAVVLRVTPNPVLSTAIVHYRLDSRTTVSITISDALGRVVSRPVVDEMQERGENQLVLETEGLAAGVYHCTVKTGNNQRVTSVVIIR